MKLIISAVLLLLSATAFAGPYVEYKNEYEMKDWRYTKDVNHLRFGYKADNNLYFEIGPMTDGYSHEAGYKFKVNKFTFKGKLETKDTDFAQPKSKLETEIRYTF